MKYYSKVQFVIGREITHKKIKAKYGRREKSQLLFLAQFKSGKNKKSEKGYIRFEHYLPILFS